MAHRGHRKEAGFYPRWNEKSVEEKRGQYDPISGCRRPLVLLSRQAAMGAGMGTEGCCRHLSKR